MFDPSDITPIFFPYPNLAQVLRDQPLHSMFLLPNEEEPKLPVVGAVVRFLYGNPNAPSDAGLAEVISVKLVRIADLDPSDIDHNHTGCGCPHEVMLFMAAHQNEIEVSLSTRIVVVTFRRHSYSLDELNGWYDYHPKVAAPGAKTPAAARTASPATPTPVQDAHTNPPRPAAPEMPGAPAVPGSAEPKRKLLKVRRRTK